MSDKEALDRLTNKIPGHFIVDGFTFKATEIVAIDDDFKTFKITCHFEDKDDAEHFIRLMKKKHFRFCIPGFLDWEKAECTLWEYSYLTSAFSYPCRVHCHISIKDLIEDMTDEEK